MTFKEFENAINHQNFKELALNKRLQVRSGHKSLELIVIEHPLQPKDEGCLQIPIDYLKTAPEKVLAMIFSKLGANTIIFARNCGVRKTERPEAELFLNRYHIMGSTQSAFNLGLYYKDDLVALASFSKGRKMNRLREDQRSFEMIRFCCKTGITVAGGLTKLVKNFCLQKTAGDIMTYVDKQFSEGKAFVKSGFKIHGETAPNYFLVDKKTFERAALKNKNATFDERTHYLIQNCGNIKLVYTPPET